MLTLIKQTPSFQIELYKPFDHLCPLSDLKVCKNLQNPSIKLLPNS